METARLVASLLLLAACAGALEVRTPSVATMARLRPSVGNFEKGAPVLRGGASAPARLLDPPRYLSFIGVFSSMTGIVQLFLAWYNPALLNEAVPDLAKSKSFKTVFSWFSVVCTGSGALYRELAENGTPASQDVACKAAAKATGLATAIAIESLVNNPDVEPTSACFAVASNFGLCLSGIATQIGS